MSFLARSGQPPQPLFESDDNRMPHAAGVADLASQFAGSFDSGRIGSWLGWWHDVGKVAPDVQRYLRGETDLKRGLDHSSAGMLAALELGRLWPLAFVIAGHHAGLADESSERGSNLRARIDQKRRDARVTEALALGRPFAEKHAPTLNEADLPPFVQGEHVAEFWLRMLHSTLVDADCLDAQRFSEPDTFALRWRDGDLAPLWDALDADQETLIAKHAHESDVNAARAEVYRACVRAAAQPPGVYSLTVPTGGGKTRSAMGFGLRHALAHGQRRVIVALPYTSIIEQNADVYRDLFHDTNPDAVIEHHSAFDRSRLRVREDDSDDEAELRHRLACENWDAPIVVTTTVQLLESLFSNRNGRLRKLHRIARSVLILDEVQTLPPHLLAPTLDVLQHLVDAYGVTILLCTATPPALAQRDGFDGFAHVTEIVSDPPALFAGLARVVYERPDTPWMYADVAAELAGATQAMAILNTKKDAMAVLDALEVEGAGAVLHLSTQLCGAHRRHVLTEVRRRLANEEPIRLVATQVVEAGVDLDFPLVLRALGPLDRIVQAAGRCNREGTLGLHGGRVVVFDLDGGGTPLGAYRRGLDITASMLKAHPGLDFDNPDTAREYFRQHYDLSDVDRKNIQELRRRLLFEQTAHAYRLIDDDTVPVAVAYEGGAEPVLHRIEATGRASAQDYRALQPYLVNLYERAHRQAQANGLCMEIAPDVWRWIGDYDELRGLLMQIPTLTDYVV